MHRQLHTQVRRDCIYTRKEKPQDFHLFSAQQSLSQHAIVYSYAIFYSKIWPRLINLGWSYFIPLVLSNFQSSFSGLVLLSSILLYGVKFYNIPFRLILQFWCQFYMQFYILYLMCNCIMFYKCHVCEYACGGLSQAFSLLNPPVWLYMLPFQFVFCLFVCLFFYMSINWNDEII